MNIQQKNQWTMHFEINQENLEQENINNMDTINKISELYEKIEI